MCADVQALAEQKRQILAFLENRMHYIAPNLAAIVGAGVASRLVAAAGGIQELARMPAGNIQVLGAQKKALQGMSTAGLGLHRGFIADAELVVGAPPKHKIRVVRMLSTKGALAARVDASRHCPSGEEGRRLKA